LPNDPKYQRVTVLTLTDTLTQAEFDDAYREGSTVEQASEEDTEAVNANPELLTDELYEGDGKWEIKVTITPMNEGE